MQFYEKTPVFYDAFHLELEPEQDLRDLTDWEIRISGKSFLTLPFDTLQAD